MPAYFLLPHIYPCRTEDGLVFLDLRRGRYLALGKEHQGVLHAEAGETSLPGQPDSTNPDQADRQTVAGIQTLLENNVLTRDPHLGKRLIWLTMEAARAIPFIEVVEARAHAGHILTLLQAWIKASYRLRFRSLEKIVTDVRRKKARTSAASRRNTEDNARNLASIFCRLRPLVFTSREACVLDSLVLLEFLAAYDVFPTWFFGVRTQPFYAHSWVQHGELVLNDSADNVRAYSPILAI